MLAATLNLEVSKKERRLLKRLLWSLSLGGLFLIGCGKKGPMVQEQAAPVITQVKDKEAFQASVEQAEKDREQIRAIEQGEQDLREKKLELDMLKAEGANETEIEKARLKYEASLSDYQSRLAAAGVSANAKEIEAYLGAGASLAGGIFQYKADTEILAKNARLADRQAGFQQYATDARKEVAMANLEAQELLADKEILRLKMLANNRASAAGHQIPYPEIENQGSENQGSENQGSENPTGVTQSPSPSASSSSAPTTGIPEYAEDYLCYGGSGGVGDCDAEVQNSYLSQMNKGLADLYNQLKTCDSVHFFKDNKSCRDSTLEGFGRTILNSHQDIATQIEGSGVLSPVMKDTLQAKIEKNQAALLHFVGEAKNWEDADLPGEAPTLNDVIEAHAAFLDVEERNLSSITRDVGAVFARLDPEPGPRQGNGTEVDSNPKNGAGSKRQNPEGRSEVFRGK